MRAGRALVMLGFLALAPVLALQALTNAKVYIFPAGDWNGFGVALQSLARLQVEQGEAGQVELSVRPPGPALARDAFAREPLALDALFVLTIEEGQSNPANARRLLQLASQLEKRNQNIGAAVLQNAALAGDLAGALAAMDRLAVVYPEISPAIVEALLPFLADARQLPVFERALRSDPAWARAFWMAAPGKSESLENLLQLRSSIGGTAAKQGDEQLLQGLVRAGRYQDAMVLWQEISGVGGNATGFINSDAYPPFGWQLVQSASRSMASTGSGQYAVHLQGEISGELAKQLVRFGPGEYRIAVAVEPADLASSLRVALQCAGGKGPPDWRPISDPRPWVVGEGCSMFWLLIGADTWDAGTGVSGTVSDVAIVRR